MRYNTPDCSRGHREQSTNALERPMHTIVQSTRRYTIFKIVSKAYLYNILSVLCRILENRAAVLQVLFVKAERLVVHLSEALVPQLGFLQVGQEVGVDGATLDEAHAAEHCAILNKSFFVFHRQEQRRNLETHWILKCCRRTARLSHAPSIANLLAQYTSLKGRPVGEHTAPQTPGVVLAISSRALLHKHGSVFEI